MIKEKKGRLFVNRTDLMQKIQAYYRDGQKNLLQFIKIAEYMPEKKSPKEPSIKKQIHSVSELRNVLALQPLISETSPAERERYELSDLEITYEEVLSLLKEATPRNIELMTARLGKLKQPTAIRDLTIKIILCTIISNWEIHLITVREWAKVTKEPFFGKKPAITLIVKKGNQKVLLQDILPDLLKSENKESIASEDLEAQDSKNIEKEADWAKAQLQSKITLFVPVNFSTSLPFETLSLEKQAVVEEAFKSEGISDMIQNYTYDFVTCTEDQLPASYWENPVSKASFIDPVKTITKIETLEKKIQQEGFNPQFPLLLTGMSEGRVGVDGGHHRLQAVRNLIEKNLLDRNFSIPCLIRYHKDWFNYRNTKLHFPGFWDVDYKNTLLTTKLADQWITIWFYRNKPLKEKKNVYFRSMVSMPMFFDSKTQILHVRKPWHPADVKFTPRLLRFLRTRFSMVQVDEPQKADQTEIIPPCDQIVKITTPNLPQFRTSYQGLISNFIQPQVMTQYEKDAIQLGIIAPIFTLMDTIPVLFQTPVYSFALVLYAKNPRESRIGITINENTPFIIDFFQGEREKALALQQQMHLFLGWPLTVTENVAENFLQAHSALQSLLPFIDIPGASGFRVGFDGQHYTFSFLKPQNPVHKFLDGCSESLFWFLQGSGESVQDQILQLIVIQLLLQKGATNRPEFQNQNNIGQYTQLLKRITFLKNQIMMQFLQDHYSQSEEKIILHLLQQS